MEGAPGSREKRGVPGGLFDFGSEEAATSAGDGGSFSGESKNAKKRKAKEYLEGAELLTSLGKKQLRNLSPFLDDSILDLVVLAQKLSVRNQGRKRLEQTIAKLLRTTNIGPDYIRRHTR